VFSSVLFHLVVLILLISYEAGLLPRVCISNDEKAMSVFNSFPICLVDYNILKSQKLSKIHLYLDSSLLYTPQADFCQEQCFMTCIYAYIMLLENTICFPAVVILTGCKRYPKKRNSTKITHNNINNTRPSA
jgi:hypothetical protein